MIVRNKFRVITVNTFDSKAIIKDYVSAAQ